MASPAAKGPKRALPGAPERADRAHERLPEVVPGPAGPPRVGEWLFTTRPGAERDLVDELFYARAAPRPVTESLVAASKAVSEPAFARQGFPIAALVTPDALGPALEALLRRQPRLESWALDVWVPDSDLGNRLAAQAATLGQVAIGGPWAARRVADARAALADNGLYLQACLLPPGDRLAVGLVPAREALSLAPGGRLRVHVPAAAPSRAAMKLLEAFAWLDRAPEAGDLCVDLGAAPGGWSWVLLERRARVIAVDPARLARSLIGKRGLTHVRGDAFSFAPPEPIDWLFSDMAWRPLESAALLAKWARRSFARLLVANIKLPMRKKAEMLVRVREILTEGGWQNLRVRQLYHDREEVTVAAVRI